MRSARFMMQRIQAARMTSVSRVTFPLLCGVRNSVNSKTHEDTSLTNRGDPTLTEVAERGSLDNSCDALTGPHFLNPYPKSCCLTSIIDYNAARPIDIAFLRFAFLTI